MVFNKTARNFNQDMVQAAKCTIVEVEEIVEPGQLKPDEIHVPGIYVDYLYKPAKFEKRFEKITLSEGNPASGKQKDTAKRDKIIKRAAKEVKDGMYVNLGIGIPTLLPNFVEPGIVIELQSENGVLGLGPYPRKGEEDPDLINAGKVLFRYS